MVGVCLVCGSGRKLWCGEHELGLPSLGGFQPVGHDGKQHLDAAMLAAAAKTTKNSTLTPKKNPPLPFPITTTAFSRLTPRLLTPLPRALNYLSL